MKDSEGFEDLDFVYCGRRQAINKNIVMAVRVIRSDKTLDPVEKLYAWNSKYKQFTIGGIYRGAKFSDTQSLGLSIARWVAQQKREDAMLWRAKDEETEIEVKRVKLETDFRRSNEIDDAMLVLRDRYQKLIGWSDRAALEAAVLRSLRKPIKKD